MYCNVYWKSIVHFDYINVMIFVNVLSVAYQCYNHECVNVLGEWICKWNPPEILAVCEFFWVCAFVLLWKLRITTNTTVFKCDCMNVYLYCFNWFENLTNSVSNFHRFSIFFIWVYYSVQYRSFILIKTSFKLW